MTEPSQYFKGRTVQEQMNEVIGYVDVRSAEVATTAIAADVAQVHQDMLDADADAQAAAASAAAAAGTLANAVKKTGEASQSIAGNVAIAGTLSGGTVTVPTPVNNTDAASKKYVDDKDALDVHLAGSEAITGAKTVPLETTGTFSNQIASSNKVKNELDNYALVVRTTGSQVITGPKKFQSNVESHKTGNSNPCFTAIRDDAPDLQTPRYILAYSVNTANGDWVTQLEARINSDGTSSLWVFVRNSDGTPKYIELGKGNVI